VRLSTSAFIHIFNPALPSCVRHGLCLAVRLNLQFGLPSCVRRGSASPFRLSIWSGALPPVRASPLIIRNLWAIGRTRGIAQCLVAYLPAGQATASRRTAEPFQDCAFASKLETLHLDA